MKANRRVLSYFLMVSIVVFVMLNVFIFSINKTYESNFWSGYVFIVAGYIVANIFCVLPVCFGKEKEVFYAVPVTIISLIYIGLQVLTGLCVILVPNFNVLASIVLQLFLFFVYMIVVLCLLFYKGNAESRRYEVKKEHQFKNEMEVRLAEIMQCTDDRDRKEKVKILLEQVQFECANNSTEESERLEKEIYVMVGKVQGLIRNGEMNEFEVTCTSLSAMLKQRDAICKNRM